MFAKILASIDTSDMSQHVFEEAVSLAKATGGNLMLLHVLSPLDEEYIDPLFIEPAILYTELQTEVHRKSLKNWEQLKHSRGDWLRSLCDSATTSGVKTEFTLSIGNSSRIICDIARGWDADTIVIGRRGRRGLSELFLGSVSNYVMHHAPCSVLTVQGPILSTTEEEETQKIEAESAVLKK